MILTITPAQTSGLDKSVLQAFTYTMPQTNTTVATAQPRPGTNSNLAPLTGSSTA
jgi:hypothetical protein